MFISILLFWAQVPGIGPATVRVLKEHEITTTYQLIGKYLSLKGEGVEPVEHADRFYFWLKNISKFITISTFRSSFSYRH